MLRTRFRVNPDSIVAWMSRNSFRFRTCFVKGVPWHSGNYRVGIHSKTRTWYDKNTQYHIDCNKKELIENSPGVTWLKFFSEKNNSSLFELETRNRSNVNATWWCRNTDSENLKHWLHKKWSFPLRISSLNVTKSAGNCGFGRIYWINP